MRINNNMMSNLQRRIVGSPDTIKKDDINKAQGNDKKPQNNKIDDRFKSPTERLLSTYFDIEV